MTLILQIAVGVALAPVLAGIVVLVGLFLYAVVADIASDIRRGVEWLDVSPAGRGIVAASIAFVCMSIFVGLLM